MKFSNPLLAVTDMEKSVNFYRDVLGLHVIMDFGANKTLTGGLSLQTLETWEEFIGTKDVTFGSNNCELYFEADDFDTFAEKLNLYDIQYVHPVRSTRGDNVSYVFTIRTGISSRSVRI